MALVFNEEILKMSHLTRLPWERPHISFQATTSFLARNSISRTIQAI